MRRTPWPAFVLAAALVAAGAGAGAATRDAGWCGTALQGAAAAVRAHHEQASRLGSAHVASPRADGDAGEIAVLVDGGDLVLRPNPIDLRSAGLLFVPAGDGFRVTRADSAVTPDAGEALPLGDDDTRAVALSFSFPFYGTSYDRVFVNSDGNLSFGAGDGASTPRDLVRLLEGPPRVAPLLADFDPSAGGSVRTLSEGDRFTVTWTAVPRWGEPDANTFRVTLRADGSVELAYGERLSSAVEGVAGVAPGGGGELTGVDLSEAAGTEGRALAEAFRETEELDLVAVARRFYEGHGDDYQQLVVFTIRRLTEPGTVAFEQTVRNRIRGIGFASFDFGSEYGSPTGLESVVMMDSVAKYPADPSAVAFPPDSALGVLAHETGHRWLATVRIEDGVNSGEQLLGRQQAHWSFFMNSSGSHLEGNEIEDLGGGRFQTVAASVRYGPLDQYLMGVRTPEEVPPFFFVSQVSGTGITDRGRNPQAGVSFNGRRNDVTVGHVIAAEGARSPAPAAPDRPWRQAFVLVGAEGAPSEAVVEQLERLRLAWPEFFARSIEGRWSVEAELR